MLFYVNSFAYEVLFLINGQVKYNLSYVRLINRMNNKDLRVLYLRNGFSQTVVDVSGVIFFTLEQRLVPLILTFTKYHRDGRFVLSLLYVCT